MFTGREHTQIVATRTWRYWTCSCRPTTEWRQRLHVLRFGRKENEEAETETETEEELEITEITPESLFTP